MSQGPVAALQSGAMDAAPLLFEHDPLPEHTSHFRLLRIIRGAFGQHVECEISTWPIASAPPYLAISYTWGNPADTTEITINGRRLVVRRNCEYVLQQAFASRPGEYFWVDAICIAQTTQEKNHQVGIMGQIYSGAKHVLACVGPHENDSEFLLEAIKKYDALFKSIRAVLDLQQYNAWENPIQGHMKVLLRCLLSMRSKTRQRLYHAFRAFIQRPYFTRVWVMQELHLATSVSYCFGMAVHTAEDFLSLHWLMRFWTIPMYDSYRTPMLVRRFFVIGRYTWAYSRTNFSKEMLFEYTMHETGTTLLGLGCTKGKLRPVDVLLNTNLECTDPRDRLYGVLSLVNWPDQQKPEADYQKDYFQVAADVFEYFPKSWNNENACYGALALCRAFQALALRSNTSRPNRNSNRDDASDLVRDDCEWQGLQISDVVTSFKSSSHSGDERLRVYLSTQKGGGWSVLELHRNSETMIFPAPLGTRNGDWLVFESSVLGERGFLGLIVRISESGAYTVVGQVYVREFDYMTFKMLLMDVANVSFAGHWHPEDLLLLGWSISKVTSGESTAHEISEFVNRRICAWDGSSYFTEKTYDFSFLLKSKLGST